jgi:hypothetical protein
MLSLDLDHFKASLLRQVHPNGVAATRVTFSPDLTGMVQKRG